jgi:single-stranded-DNA-specific exonuclease
MHSTSELPSAGAIPGIQWKLKPAKGEFARLAQQLNIHAVMARILVSRGIDSAGAAHRFLSPGWEDILNPRDLPDLDRAVNRTVRAIQRRERILVFGDYDVDGVMATAILVNAIRIAGGEASWSMPHRLLDGYGLREKHVDAAHETGASVIITADCGVRSHDAIRHANSHGIGVIVTDHHPPDHDLPPAIAIVNPNLSASAYGNTYLCGAGVAYQFVSELLRASRIPDRRIQELLASFVKLAAIATISDVMPLVGENRAIVHLGLRGLADTRAPGLRLLLESAGVGNGHSITAREIAFRVAPRINAAGRLQHASLVMDLLAERDSDRARALAESLERINYCRKQEQTRVFEEISDISEPDPKPRVLVFCGRGWHRGVLGIAAARLVERFRRPVFVLSEENGFAYGSGRSVPGINLSSLLERVRHHLETFGGHEQAAGLTLRTDRIAAFREEICAACPDLHAEDVIEIDANLRLAEIAHVWPEITRMEPLGHGNPNPIFATRVRIESPPVFVSSSVSKTRVQQNGRIFEVKQFGAGGDGIEMQPGTQVDMAYRLLSDTWRREGFAIVLEALRLPP